MQQKRIGNMGVIILAMLYPILWLSLFPEIDISEDLQQAIAEILAGTAMILMAMGIFLSLRPRWMEGFFGGLDKMYVTHRRLALTAYGFLILHFLINVDLPPDQPGTIMGTVALLGITIIIILTMAPRIPFLRNNLRLAYNQWRSIHRFIGIFFIAGLIHYIWVVPLSLGTVPGFYMASIAIAASIAYLYKQVLARFFEPDKSFKVAEVRRLNESISEVILQPTGDKLQYTAGQFQFVRFPDDSILKERHPFTISSSPKAENLRLAIKASGDWTGYLQQHIKPEMKAVVTGPYGRFNYRNGEQKQIWIAGGIGVTPFLSWLRDMDERLDHEIYFFYICKRKDDAIFWSEFEQAAASHPSFHSHLQLSSQDGRITPEQIAEMSGGSIIAKDIYLCGPSTLIKAFSQQFRAMGVPAGQIHFEEFKLR